MDIDLFFTESGDGFPLVLLHGNGGSSQYFKKQIPAFSEKYRVIAVDTRGHGNSPRGKAPFTLAQFADDLKDFLDIHCIKKTHILGFSDGANIAMLFGIKYPQYVEKLILDGGNAVDSGLVSPVLRSIKLSNILISAASRLSKKAFKKKELLSLMIGQPNLSADELKKISAPTLVMAGTADIIKENHTRFIADSIPNATIKILRGPHNVAETDSNSFNKAVLMFLK